MANFIFCGFCLKFFLRTNSKSKPRGEHPTSAYPGSLLGLRHVQACLGTLAWPAWGKDLLLVEEKEGTLCVVSHAERLIQRINLFLTPTFPHVTLSLKPTGMPFL